MTGAKAARSSRRWTLVATALVLTACATAPPQATETSEVADVEARLDVQVVVDGLDHPWDVAQLPDGTLLLTERGGSISTVDADGSHTDVRADLRDLFARGETGLMGLAIDPDFAQNRRFYTCQGNRPAHDIRVVAWRLAADYSVATREPGAVVTGLPLSSGRHGGCRLRFDGAGRLYISAGDAARGANAQDRTSLGGKVLRVNPDGSPAAGNPFLDAPEASTRLIYTLGHRNVQGLALRSDGTLYAAEHGPDIDDELNKLRAGGNYGWNPVGAGGYNESVPMTDPQIPGAIAAIWSSGDPTVAVSGSAFLGGRQWGVLDGQLAVACLRGSRLMLFDLDADGTLLTTSIPTELDGDYGRLRAVQPGRDGELYVTTDNGGDDRLLRITPAS